MFNNEQTMTATLPAISLRGRVPLPNTELRCDIALSSQIAAIQNANTYDKMIAIFVQKDPTKQTVDIDNLSNIGVIAKVVWNTSTGPVRKVKFDCITRCKIISFTQTTPYLVASIETIPSVTEDINMVTESTRLLMEKLQSNNAKIIATNPELSSILQQGVTSDKLVDSLASILPLAQNIKMHYLEEASLDKRLIMMLADLQKEESYKELDAKIEKAVQDEMQEQQKEYYLREKMKKIQEELGDKARKESEIDDIRQKIEAAGMPEEVKEHALKELSRYIDAGSFSPDATIMRSYLDFMISLPWSKQTQDTTSLDVCKEQLDKDHYGLEKVKERLLEYLAVGLYNGVMPQTILCLVGPPGVGKSSLARSVATALNKKFVKQSLGGVHDESEIRGHRRTYVGALPGRILSGIQRAGSNNPVFLLDEIDKLTSDYKGDPAAALLEVLDPEQNFAFSDHYLDEPFDLSHVFFIATANNLENIPAPLRDRLEIIEVSSYTEQEKLEIAKRHLLKKQLEKNGLAADKFSITDEAILEIIREYTMESGVRELERLIGTLVRRAIKAILLEGKERIDVTIDTLDTWLGKPKFSFSRVDNEDQVGVVTGLAWTSAGGDTLKIEVATYPGKGGLILTGNLGDVMKESAQAALSYAKAHAQEFGINQEELDSTDIHIHVPEGATPKDGPSAGVTLTTAIVSALSHKKANHLVGMTGEVTLRGKVLPIGGLREKSIAANRSGLKTILIPKDNVKDLEEVPASVKEALTIIPIETVEEAIKNTLVE